MDLKSLVGHDLNAVPVCTPFRPKVGMAAAWIFALLVVMVTDGLLYPGGMNLLIIIACLSAILIVLGQAIVGRPSGALINDQNIMSLSRFQMGVWTIVVISSYFSYALARIHAAGFGAIDATNKSDPLNIVIDPHLLALIGMSATSFVAAPFILGTKKDKVPVPTVAAKTAQASGVTLDEMDANRQGTVYGNSAIADAQLTDMFQGDEIGNTTHIDLAKVQMFFFTVIAALAYMILVFRNLESSTADLSQLPTLSDGVVYALGISHAGYLASKGVNHTPVL